MCICLIYIYIYIYIVNLTLIGKCKAINKFNKLMYKWVGLHFVELRIRLINKNINQETPIKKIN